MLEELRKLSYGIARGVPQAATGFVDLAALPLTLSGMIKPEDVVGSTDYLTKLGLLPKPEQGLLPETTELVSSLLSPAGATKAALVGTGGLLGDAVLTSGALERLPPPVGSINPKGLLSNEFNLEKDMPIKKSNLVDSEVLSKKEADFEDMAFKGDVIQARSEEESLESLFTDPNVKAQNIEIIGDNNPLGFDYESGDLEQKLNAAGFSYKDDRMGSLIIGKSKDDVEKLEKALKDQNAYSLGKMYGYSEEDIAAFYKQKYELQGLPAFKYFVQDKFKFNNPKTKLIKNKKLIELLEY